MNNKTSSRLVNEAKTLAEEIHRGQYDKGGNPYLYHVLDVAARVANLGSEYEITALLHDAVEDAPAHRPLDLMEIEQRFGKSVRDGVDAMTKRISPVPEDYLKDYMPRVAADPVGRIVKIADASHNISKAHLLDDPNEQKRLRAKYAGALSYLGQDPVEAERPMKFIDDGEFIGWREID